MLVLNPKGVTFKQLTYSTKLSELFKTIQPIKGTSKTIVKMLPFEEDYMGARMYTALWNWRANLTKFINEYNKFKENKGYSDEELENIPTSKKDYKKQKDEAER